MKDIYERVNYVFVELLPNFSDSLSETRKSKEEVGNVDELAPLDSSEGPAERTAQDLRRGRLFPVGVWFVSESLGVCSIFSRFTEIFKEKTEWELIVQRGNETDGKAPW